MTAPAPLARQLLRRKPTWQLTSHSHGGKHGVIILRRTQPDLPRGFKVPGYPATPVLTIGACLYVLWGLQWVTWLIFAIWVVVLTFYLTWGRRHSVLNRSGEGLHHLMTKDRELP
jgi:amino acid transporter